MKQFLKFSSVIAFGLALISFILLLATPGVLYKVGSFSFEYSGVKILFGEEGVKGAVLPLIGWIFIIICLAVLLCDVVAIILKKDFLAKFAKIINLVLAGLFVVAAVFIFLAVPSFLGANNIDASDGFVIGAGWVIAAILSILAGGVCLLKVILNK